ncbi:PlsC domain-containing protein [Haematococcus lacustris]|nr:PlsC domain-containing protein [Haematococcus lacustris]
MALTSVGSCNVATGPLPGLRDAGHGVPSRRSLDNASDEMVAFASSRGPDTEALASEMENAYAQAEQQRRLQSSHSMAIPEDGGPPSSSHPPLLADMLNISHVLTDGATAIVDDSFNKCFTSMAPDPWNWNAYLWPEWVLGVVLR